MKHYPGTEYDLLDVWTPTSFPYSSLVTSYKHLSAHPRHWQAFYHITNTRLYAALLKKTSKRSCYNKMFTYMEQYDPDVVVSVHPTMNYVPEKIMRELGRRRNKYIPFFTVVTDFGSCHGTWFQGKPDKIYIASDRIKTLAMESRKGFLNERNLVMTGLPIRDDFAVHAEQMGTRTSQVGKQYRNQIKKDLKLDVNKKMVLLMGGGEGVGSLGSIAEKLYLEFRAKGIDATICVVCGRNEQLKSQFENQDWDEFYTAEQVQKISNRKKLLNLITNKKGTSDADEIVKEGNVDVVALGFVNNMADYMVAADVLVSKAGPGTIAEAAAVGLPVMITRYVYSFHILHIVA
jgi:1,2-diacylglycerol 3-beta-galactosyltransferase